VIAYVDTSILLRILLRQKLTLDLGKLPSKKYSSELLGLECRRAIDRLRLESKLLDQAVAQTMEELLLFERAIGSIRMSRSVLRQSAAPMPTILKTLDAIHVTSAIMLRERKSTDVLFASHDSQQTTAARAFGFQCIGL